MKKAIILIIIFISVQLISPVFTVYAQDSQAVIGKSSIELTQFIDNYVEQNRDTTAAMSVAVFTANDIILERYYGHSSIADQVANNAEIVMDWGSVSKLLIWVSIMQLVEQGSLDLGADIYSYLPEGFLSKLKYDDPITVLNLMNHNAGWQDIFLGAESLIGWDKPDLGKALRLIEPQQVYRPGEITAYSNFGANLAGYIVEYITGIPFYEYVEKNIFAVLGMDKTTIMPGLQDNNWVKSRRDALTCYTTDLQDLGNAPYSFELYASGNAVGTLLDLCVFAQALLPDETGASPLFQSNSTIGEMFTPTGYFPDGITARNYHGFWANTILTGSVVGHNGNTAGCSAQLMIDLEKSVGIVVLTNQAGENIYCNNMVNQLFGETEYSTTPLYVDPIVGYYVYAQTARAGMPKSLGAPYVMKIAQNNDGSLTINGLITLLMGEGKVERVEMNLYMLDIAGMHMLLYADSDENGKINSLDSTVAADLFRTGAWEYHANNIVFFAFAAAVLYALVYLVIALVCKLRRKKLPLGPLRVAVCFGVISVLVNWIILFINGMMLTGSLTGKTIQGLLFVGSSIIPVAYTVIMAIRLRRLKVTAKQKAGMTTTAAAGLITTLFVVYWQLWMFWL